MPSGGTYIGAAMEGSTLLNEGNLPEAICARLAAPDPNERGIGWFIPYLGPCPQLEPQTEAVIHGPELPYPRLDSGSSWGWSS